MKTTDEDFKKWYDSNISKNDHTDGIYIVSLATWKECRKRATLGYIDLKRANELLGKASKTAFLAAGGTEEEFKVWYKKHCSVNVN